MRVGQFMRVQDGRGSLDSYCSLPLSIECPKKVTRSTLVATQGELLNVHENCEDDLLIYTDMSCTSNYSLSAFAVSGLVRDKAMK